jgi:hypothetical protein
MIKLLKYGIKFSFTNLTIIIFVKDGPLFLNKRKKIKVKIIKNIYYEVN